MMSCTRPTRCAASTTSSQSPRRPRSVACAMAGRRRRSRRILTSSSGRGQPEQEYKARMAAGSLAALLAALLPLLAVFATRSDAEEADFHELWRPSFDGWEFDGVEVADGRLALSETALVTGVGWRGTAVSPVHDSSQSFEELIPSWNA